MSTSNDYSSRDFKNHTPIALGKEQIKKNFNSGNVQDAMNGFFVENRLDLEYSDSLYWLVDELDVSRTKFHVKVLQNLTREIISDIKQARREANDNLMSLNGNSGSSIHSPLSKKINLESFINKLENYMDLDEVVVLMIELLEQLEYLTLPQSLIKALKRDFSLYRRCDVSLKRRIWLQDTEILLLDVDQILNSYCADFTLSTLNKEMSRQDMSYVTKIRREQPDLYHIFEIVNGNVSLYNIVLEAIEKKFRATFRIELCTFRFDFLMIMHYHDVRKSNSELAWLIKMISLSSNFYFVMAPSMKEFPQLLTERDINALHQLCFEIYDLKKGFIGVTDFSHLNLIEYSEVARQLVYKIVLDFIDNGEFGIVDAMLPLIWRATVRLYGRIDEADYENPRNKREGSIDKDRSEMYSSKDSNFIDDRSNLNFDPSGILPDPSSISNFIAIKNRLPWQPPQTKSAYNDSEVCFFELESFVQSLITTITSSKAMVTKLLNSGAMSNRLFMFMEKYARVNSFGHLQFLRLIEKISLILSVAMSDAFINTSLKAENSQSKQDNGLFVTEMSKSSSSNGAFGSPNLSSNTGSGSGWLASETGASRSTSSGWNSSTSTAPQFGANDDSTKPTRVANAIDADMPIIDMLGAANLAFRYSERLAAYGSVDEYSYSELVNAYNKLIASSPANAFNFRISRLNCPQINTFFKISFD
ncbi:Negative elongation factor B [Smittium mucronatum]|uniref:Negative elongation factor B n=1 Tax=Smittium mucronatum TaxID=133383 RepID=A0A1R0H4P4_9FUNG|nr:Negative elongation factor B [Smittium mucronatum]